MPGKYSLCPLIVRVRISRESMEEVQQLVTPATTCLVPNPVSQNTGNDSETHPGEGAQLPCRHERPGRQQKRRFWYREPYLVRKQHSEKNGVAVL